MALITFGAQLQLNIEESLRLPAAMPSPKSPFIQLQESGDFDSGESEPVFREGGWAWNSASQCWSTSLPKADTSGRYSRFLEILQAKVKFGNNDRR
ncbi:MAG: hypothetical protein R3E62_09380 [Pseudomonadales bacterium]